MRQAKHVKITACLVDRGTRVGLLRRFCKQIRIKEQSNMTADC
jgi:hypothetical protein